MEDPGGEGVLDQVEPELPALAPQMPGVRFQDLEESLAEAKMPYSKVELQALPRLTLHALAHFYKIDYADKTAGELRERLFNAGAVHLHSTDMFQSMNTVFNNTLVSGLLGSFP